MLDSLCKAYFYVYWQWKFLTSFHRINQEFSMQQVAASPKGCLANTRAKEALLGKRVCLVDLIWGILLNFEGLFLRSHEISLKSVLFAWDGQRGGSQVTDMWHQTTSCETIFLKEILSHFIFILWSWMKKRKNWEEYIQKIKTCDHVRNFHHCFIILVSLCVCVCVWIQIQIQTS